MGSELPIEDDDDDGGGAEWMGTFCDISLLLLCFFILLLSMSSLDTRKFKESFSSVRDTFGGSKMSDMEYTVPPNEQAKMQDMMRMQDEMLELQRQAFNDMRSFITQKGIDGVVQATIDEGTITLRLPAEILFEPGSEVMRGDSKELLSHLHDLFLKAREQTINIKGYTDDSPVRPGARFYNNWELSALRAVNVLRDLLEGGIEPVRMTATGLGDLNPLVPNTSAENRAQNRRVEFVLERRVTK